MLLTTEEAVFRLRADPCFANLVRDTYIAEDVSASATRFEASGEWQAVHELLKPCLPGATVIDLGAGNGIASRALANAGAGCVIAVEPDSSDSIGRGAIARACVGLPVEPVAGFGESIPVADASADVVFARQVLHHTRDLELTLRECHRALRPGGVFLACREHVADTPDELRAFLAAHPVHQLTGGENAHPLARYRSAITSAGFTLVREIGPWDSVINLHPAVNCDAEIAELPRRLLRTRLGALRLLADLPLFSQWANRRIRRPRPGRLYSFLARKP